MCIHVYIYIYIHTYIYVYICIDHITEILASNTGNPQGPPETEEAKRCGTDGNSLSTPAHPCTPLHTPADP